MTTAPDTTPTAAPEPAAILRSRNFVVLLVFAAVIGVIVSLRRVGLPRARPPDPGVRVHGPAARISAFDSVPDWWGTPVLGARRRSPWRSRSCKLPGKGGHVPAHGLQVGGNDPNMVPGNRARRVRDPRPRPRARAGGAAHRDRRRARGVHGEARQARRAAAAAPHHGRGRELRRDLRDLRLAHRRRDPRDRGERARRRDAAAHPDPRSHRRRRRIARVPRHGELDRSRHQRVLPRTAAAPALRRGDVGADRVDDRIRRSPVPSSPQVDPPDRARRRGGRPEAARGCSSPLAGLVVAALAILFAETTTHGADQVLFSGQEQLPGLVSSAAPGRSARSRW